MAVTALLLLADGRFPSGGHAHSGGLEAAVAGGRVRDLDGLGAYLRVRLRTGGPVAAAFASAACAGTSAGLDPIDELVDELDARTPSPALRLASRRQGRSLCRAARTVWPSPALDVVAGRPGGVPHPVALGLVGAAAGLTPQEVAVVAAYGLVTGAASAAVRLLGLDPYGVHRLLAALGGECDAVARDAATSARGPAADLPAAAEPLLDVTAEDHASWEVRLFAS